MDIYAKTIVGILLLVTGFLATLTMFHLQGRGDGSGKPSRLRGAHRILGFVFFVLLLVLVFTGIRYVAWGRGEPSARANLHVVLASALFTLFVLKLLIVRFYRGLLRYVSTLGLIVFVLTALVFSTSAGYYLARRGEMAHWDLETPVDNVEESAASAPERASGDAARGAAVYEQYCAYCHYADRTDSKLGPGLAGVLKAEKLPTSGRPATVENILSTLENPIGTMPAFTELTEQELEDLIAYLETI